MQEKNSTRSKFLILVIIFFNSFHLLYSLLIIIYFISLKQQKSMLYSSLTGLRERENYAIGKFVIFLLSLVIFFNLICPQSAICPTIASIRFHFFLISQVTKNIEIFEEI